MAPKAMIVYGSSHKGLAFNQAFRRRYEELGGGPLPEGSWIEHRHRMGDPITTRIVQEWGLAACGEGLGVAYVDAEALPAARIAEYDGFETVEVDHSLLLTHLCRAHFGAHEALTLEQFEELCARSRRASVELRREDDDGADANNPKPRARMPPQQQPLTCSVPLRNPFELLAGLGNNA